MKDADHITFEAEFFDGITPLSIRGVIYIVSGRIHFNQHIDGASCERYFEISNIVTISKKHAKTVVQFQEDADCISAQIIVQGEAIYRQLIDNQRYGNFSLFRKLSHLSKKSIFIFSILFFPIAFLFFVFISQHLYIVIPVSFDKLLGAKAAEQFFYEETIVKDEKLQKSIENVARQVIPSEFEGEITIKIIQKDAINAFALPNGEIYIFSGLLKIIENQEELAALIAHEVIHISKRHGIQQLSKSLSTIFFTTMVIGMGFDELEFAETVAELSTLLLTLQYSRVHEQEADRGAVDLLYAAAINPQACISLYQKIEKANENAPLQILSTHPSDDNRKSYVQNYILTLKPQLYMKLVQPQNWLETIQVLK